MTSQMSEEQIYEEAKKRIEARRGFYSHLAAYVIVNVMLILIWAFVSDDAFPWFIFPLVGWGIGILFHFLGVFVFEGKSRREAIEKEMDRIRKGD